MTLQTLLERVFGDAPPVAVVAYDGARVGAADAPVTVVLRSREALQRLVAGRGREMAFARAYVAGEIDIDGDIFALLDARRLVELPVPTPSLVRDVATAAGYDWRRPTTLRPPPPPPEEVRLRGRRHSRARDAKAISSHYDVSNRFYRLVLGPSMTYSCAVFASEHDSLEQAQSNKHELICRKLGLRPGMRLLDIGCGWGGLVLHAARHHGVSAVGITISEAQAEHADKRVAEAGYGGAVEIRLQDYRDVHDGPFDAVSSVGMLEHVGEAKMQTYLAQVATLLRPGGRFLNHAITRARPAGARDVRNGFVNRYVFPDGELLELHQIVGGIQHEGLEVRHVETLREHYERTLRAWVANLEASWQEAVAEIGEARARIWRLYMAGSALAFAANDIQVQQVLAVLPERGHSAMPLHLDW
jgi:cyclopropane-fatty-acyl-phospholipid synthase